MERERTPQYEIRKVSLDDVEAVRRMHAKLWLATYPNEEAGVPLAWVQEETDRWLTEEALANSHERFVALIDDPDQFYRVAEDNGKIIGIVHGSVQDDHKHLNALYVDADYHGKGVARELMRQADEWFGDDEVDLEVITYNERAIRFYQKHGFELIDKENELFKGKMPNKTMVRKRREA